VIAQARRLVALVDPAAPSQGLHAEEEVQRLCETLLDWEAAATADHAAEAIPSHTAALVAEAEAWLRAHLQEPIRIDDLARHLCRTPRSLQLAFQRERGCSPMQRLKRLRLQALHRRLQRQDLATQPVAGLLASVGLPGDGRIRSEFRDWCGASPQELRRQALEPVRR
jgi:transcriptional regulator GlxA family with amidase domain